jgi:hypothetical protein
LEEDRRHPLIKDDFDVKELNKYDYGLPKPTRKISKPIKKRSGPLSELLS